MFDKAEYVYEIYKTGSFSRAAKNLYISQPALSSCINKIEKELHCQLFDRSTHPITMTEVGQVYIDIYERMTALEQLFYNRLSEINNLETGHLTVGGASFFASYMLPPIMKVYAQIHPSIEFDIVESDSISLYEMALDRSIDLILDAGGYDKDLFDADHIMTEQILLAVPSRDPINLSLDKYQFTYADIVAMRHKSCDLFAPIMPFCDKNFILLKKGHDMHTRSLAICQQHGFTPRRAVFLNQLATAYNLARNEMGIAFVTDTLVRLAPPADNLVYYAIEGQSAFRDIFLAYKKNTIITKPMEAFMQTARTVSTEELTLPR